MLFVMRKLARRSRPRKEQLAPLRNLAHLRRARNITQARLARRVRCCVRAIEYYESCQRVPDADLVQRIADALGVAPEVLSSPAIDLWVRPAGLVVVDRSEGRRS